MGVKSAGVVAHLNNPAGSSIRLTPPPPHATSTTHALSAHIEHRQPCGARPVVAAGGWQAGRRVSRANEWLPGPAQQVSGNCASPLISTTRCQAMRDRPAAARRLRSKQSNAAGWRLRPSCGASGTGRRGGGAGGWASTHSQPPLSQASATPLTPSAPCRCC